MDMLRKDVVETVDYGLAGFTKMLATQCTQRSWRGAYSEARYHCDIRYCSVIEAFAKVHSTEAKKFFTANNDAWCQYPESSPL